MKLMTKDSDYAIRALLVLAAGCDGFISARAISRREKIPYQFLRKILGALQQGGFVASREGAGGGYALTVKANEIRIIDVLDVIQGEIALTDCMFRAEACANREACVLRHEIKRIEKLVADEFSKITIGSLHSRSVDGSDLKTGKS